MKPTVSVLIPSYNHSRFLGKAIESVLAQTFGEWEIVLVDDGSTDDSVQVARSYGDPRIRIYENEANLGTYGNQQKALTLAEAPWIAVLNSDDVWAPNKLESQVAALERHPECAFSYVLGWMIDADGRAQTDDDVHLDWPTDELQRPLPYLLYENRILASSVVFRRDGLRFETSLRYSGDWAALLEASARGPAACVPERLTFWRQHENNTYKVSVNQVIEEIRIRKAIEACADRWFALHPNRREVLLGLAKNAMNLVVLHAYLLDMAPARQAAIRALRWHPDKRKALKRAIGAFLPGRSVRRHFSRECGLDWETVDHLAAQKKIQSQEPLRLQIG